MEEKQVAVCYNNLWKLLIDRNMNKTELKEDSGSSFNVMATYILGFGSYKGFMK